MRVPIVPGREPDGTVPPALMLEVPDYPMVLAFLRLWQGKTLPQSALKLWPIWAGILKSADRLRHNH